MTPTTLASPPNGTTNGHTNGTTNGTANGASHSASRGHHAAPPERAEVPPTREEAEAAVRTLLAWAGDDPAREGLLETPARVARAFEEFFRGYGERPEDVLAKTFREVEGYRGLVVVKDIELASHCEHHMVPFTGVAHVAYLPSDRVVGLSKLARLVDLYARRLQIQERLTMQVADAIERVLAPRGVAVMISSRHHCMTLRGVRKPDAVTVTSHFSGELETDAELRRQFMEQVRAG